MEGFQAAAIFLVSIGKLEHVTKFLKACLTLADLDIDEEDEDDHEVDVPHEPRSENNVIVHRATRALEVRIDLVYHAYRYSSNSVV